VRSPSKTRGRRASRISLKVVCGHGKPIIDGTSMSEKHCFTATEFLKQERRYLLPAPKREQGVSREDKPINDGLRKWMLAE